MRKKERKMGVYNLFTIKNQTFSHLPLDKRKKMWQENHEFDKPPNSAGLGSPTYAFGVTKQAFSMMTFSTGTVFSVR